MNSKQKIGCESTVCNKNKAPTLYVLVKKIDIETKASKYVCQPNPNRSQYFHMQVPKKKR